MWTRHLSRRGGQGFSGLLGSSVKEDASARAGGRRCTRRAIVRTSGSHREDVLIRSRRRSEPGMVCPGLYAGPLLRADRNWDSEVGQGKRKSGAAAAAVGGSTGSSSRHQEKQQKAAGACRVFLPGASRSPSPSTVWTDAAMMGMPSGDSNSA